MVELIFTKTFPEIVLTDEAGRTLLVWYAKYCQAGLKAPSVVIKLMKTINHERTRSTIISLDSAEMYIIYKWHNATIAQGEEYFKPQVLQKLVDLIAPYAHPIGPRWQYSTEYRDVIDDHDCVLAIERRNVPISSQQRNQVVEI